MKQSLLLFLSFCMVQASVGQEWQPLYLNETLNYQSSANPDEIIGFFAGDLSNTSDSSDVRIVLDTDSLDDCNCETSCFLLKAGHFQSSISFLTNGVVSFQNPDTFYIHTRANLGETWVFKNDPAGDVMATVSAVSITEVLGETDSLKTISLSNDEEIHLSKNHGIIKWISAADTLTLFSIPSRGLGDVYLTKAEVYDFNVGDVFCYVTDDNHFIPNEGPSTQDDFRNRRILRFEVMSITESDSMREIEFALNGYQILFSQYDSGPPNIMQGYLAFTINTIIDLSTHEEMYELPVMKYWYEGAYLNLDEDYWAQGNYVDFFQETGGWSSFFLEKMIRVNTEMFNNRKMLSYGLKDVNLGFNSETTIPDLLEMELDLENNTDYITECLIEGEFNAGDTLFKDLSIYKEDFKMVAEGLGVVVYYGRFMYSIGPTATFKSIMTGYKKGEETYGYVPEVIDLISVGVSNAYAQINFSVFPNPADNVIQVQMPTADLGRLTILDISGRELFSTSIASEKMEVETSQYPPGIYFIRVETQNGTGVRKFVVVR